jgi:DNA-binding NtrC family response regulator
VQYNKPYTELSQGTMRLFMDYDWPGNIRELENLIKRTVILGTEAPIQKEISHGIAMASQRVASHQSSVVGRQSVLSHPAVSAIRNPHAAMAGTSPAAAPAGVLTPTEIATAATEAGNYSLKDISRTAAREAERELIFKMLQQTRWNRKETAEILGISYKALLYKIKENGLDKAS